MAVDDPQVFQTETSWSLQNILAMSNVVKNPSSQKQMHVPASCYYQWCMTHMTTSKKMSPLHLQIPGDVHMHNVLKLFPQSFEIN